MKHVLSIAILMCVAAYVLVVPPQVGYSQKDTISLPPGAAITTPPKSFIDSADLLKLDELKRADQRQKAELIKKAQQAEQRALKAGRAMDRLADQLSDIPSVPDTCIAQTPMDSCACKGRFYVLHDATPQPKTWWGKFFKLMGECKLFHKK